MKKQIRIYIYIIGLILIDQLSKVWALSALRGTEGIVVIPNVFELSYLENRGRLLEFFRIIRFSLY